jgi:hypothetical protein
MAGDKIETLGDLVDHHDSVGAWCPGGHGFRPLDMNMVIARLGRDRRFVVRGWPICCAPCGSRLMIRIAGDQRGPAEREANKGKPLPLSTQAGGAY